MAEEQVKKLYSKEKIGVTVMLVGLTAAIFLAIGYWAGSQSEFPPPPKEEADLSQLEEPPVRELSGISSEDTSEDRATALNATQDTGSLITQEQAVEMVKKLSEVQSFFERVSYASTQVENDNENNAWSVQVFEDDPNTDHISTFNWYRVDKTTGNITTLF